MIRERASWPVPRTVWRYRDRGHDALLAELRTALERGVAVTLRWVGGLRVTVVRNGGRYLVRRADGFPIATVDTIGQAVAAADQYVAESAAADDESDDDFGGAA